MKKEWDNKWEVLKKEIQDLIASFEEKRKRYARRKNIIQILLVCLAAVTSLSIGLSFVEKIAYGCKIASMLLSFITTIITGISSIYNYEQRWRQRSRTYLKLLELKRDLKLEEVLTDQVFRQYKERLNAIMKEDGELWLEITENPQLGKKDNQDSDEENQV